MSDKIKTTQEELDKLPPAVKKQAEETNRLIDKHREAEEPEKELEKPEEEPKKEPEVKKEPEKEPVEPKEPDVKSLEQTVKDLEQDNAEWKQRYKTLQGMWRKNEEMKLTLQNEIAGMKAQKQTPKKREPEPALADSLSQDTIKQLEDAGYTKEDTNALSTLVNEAVKKYVEPSLEQISQEVKSNTETAEQNRQETFWSEMERTIPDRLDLEAHPKFEDFMLEKIPYSNMTRDQRLKEAANNLELPMIQKIYKDFADHIDKKPTPPPEKPKPVVEPKSGIAAQPNTNEKPSFKRSEIQGLYNKVAKLLSDPKTEAEGKKLEADINAAYVDGRII